MKQVHYQHVIEKSPEEVVTRMHWEMRKISVPVIEIRT